MSDLNKPVILVKFSFDMHVMYEEMYRDDFEDLLHEFIYETHPIISYTKFGGMKACFVRDKLLHISEVPEIELEEWRDAFYD